MTHLNPAKPQPAEYILGTHDEELARLDLQHRLWSPYAINLWERAGFAPGHHVLDIGCGPGFATQDLAMLVGPQGRIVAVDESERYLSHLQSRLAAARSSTDPAPVETRQGDVQILGPLIPDESFHAAYARWVLCFVPRPADVLRGVHAALKPRGVFAIQDYFNYESLTLAPRSEPFSRVVAATAKSWRDRGGDPDIAGRLPRMLIDAGFEMREVRAHTRIARPCDLLWRWPESFWAIFTPRLVEMGCLSDADARAFFDDWRARSNDPATFVQTPTVYDIIAVKA